VVVNEVIAFFCGSYEGIRISSVRTFSAVGMVDNSCGLKLAKHQKSHNVNGIRGEEFSPYFAISFSFFSGHDGSLPKLRVKSRDYFVIPAFLCNTANDFWQ